MRTGWVNKAGEHLVSWGVSLWQNQTVVKVGEHIDFPTAKPPFEAEVAAIAEVRMRVTAQGKRRWLAVVRLTNRVEG